MYSAICGFLAAGVGLLASWFWIQAATVQVLTKTAGGYGSMLGGELVVKGVSGERLNFIETFVLQSKWNKRAAIASACAAPLGGLSALLSGLHL
jgi:hypothetical protein